MEVSLFSRCRSGTRSTGPIGTGMKRHQHIDIAVRADISTYDRAGERKLDNLSLPAELRNRFFGDA